MRGLYVHSASTRFATWVYYLTSNPRSGQVSQIPCAVYQDRTTMTFRLMDTIGWIGGATQTGNSEFHVAECMYIEAALNDADLFAIWDSMKTDYGLWT